MSKNLPTAKREVIYARVSPEQKAQLLSISERLGSPGNMSVGFRWVVEKVLPQALDRLEVQNVQSK